MSNFLIIQHVTDATWCSTENPLRGREATPAKVFILLADCLYCGHLDVVFGSQIVLTNDALHIRLEYVSMSLTSTEMLGTLETNRTHIYTVLC